MPDLSARRTFAISVVRQLREAGFEALWAGGCVRDLLLERQPEDFDVATSASLKKSASCSDTNARWQ